MCEVSKRHAIELADDDRKSRDDDFNSRVHDFKSR
jgi:hypothetical protein